MKLNYYKIFGSSVIVAALCVAPVFAFASQTITFTSNWSPGGTFTLSGTVDSITMSNTGVNSVTMVSGETLTITHSTNDVTVNDSSGTVTNTKTCTSSVATDAITTSTTTATTFSISPAGACTPAATTTTGSSSGGGGVTSIGSLSSGGGGGGGAATFAPTTVPATTTTTPTPTRPAVVAAPTAVSISKQIGAGSRNDDVKALQEFLAKDKSLYPEGLATGYYGPATTRAVKRFQKKYGLPQVGRVGPATLKKLNELMSVTIPAAAAPVTTPAPASAPVTTITPAPTTTPAPAPTPTPTPTPAPTPAPSPYPYNSSSHYF